MADTFTQLYIHLVFAVKNRTSFIQPAWKDALYKYLTAVVQNDGHKMLAINGMPDHVHIFIGLNPAVSISNVVKDMKRAGGNWIRENQFVKGKFEWQEGYGAFSYGRSQIGDVCRYIERQEEHHAVRTFREEYVQLLRAFEVDYKDEYLFEFYE